MNQRLDLFKFYFFSQIQLKIFELVQLQLAIIKTYNKFQQKQQMRRQKKFDQNPESQQSKNIVGYLNDARLFKKEHIKFSTPHKIQFFDNISHIKTQLYSTKNQDLDDPQLTGRNTFISERPQKQRKKVKYNLNQLNNMQIEDEPRVSFQFQNLNFSNNRNQIKNTNMKIVPQKRNRFYLNNQIQLGSQIQDEDNQKILSGYFNKLNITPKQKHRSFSPYSNQTAASKFDTRSKSPLSISHSKLFSKFSKQTNEYLKSMLQQLNLSQQQLYLTRKQVTQSIYKTIKQRSIELRNEMIDIVEELISQWQREELRFAQENEMNYMDDILELEAQIKERQNKINSFLSQLRINFFGEGKFNIENYNKLQSRYPFSSQNQSLNKGQTWRSLLADLLTFNYQDSIIELKYLTERVCLTITEKCNRAIKILPSTQLFSKSSHYELLSIQKRKQLKKCIKYIFYPHLQIQQDNDLKVQNNRDQNNQTQNKYQNVDKNLILY